MAIDFKVSVDIPPLDLKTPKADWWEKRGIEAAKEIRVRTEDKGLDVKGQGFRAYSPSYSKYRAETGRSTTPNLSYSGRMLGAMAKGVRASKDKAVITLSGAEGGKAYTNEARGREFFSLSESQVDKLAQKYLDSIDI